MKKKKIIIITIAFLLVITFGTGIFYGIRTNPKLLFHELYVSKWNAPGARYAICRANVKGKPIEAFDDCWIWFRTNSEKSDIINTNKDAYVGEITYYDTGIIEQASLFFAEDNYYVMFSDQDGYTIRNSYLTCHTNFLRCRIPSPVPLVISYELFTLYQLEFNENYLDYLYNNYTFDDIVKFYERISKEYVSIDKEKQRITLDGFDIWEGEMLDKCLILDFKNRTVILFGEDGNKKVLDGTEHERF